MLNLKSNKDHMLKSIKIVLSQANVKKVTSSEILRACKGRAAEMALIKYAEEFKKSGLI